MQDTNLLNRTKVAYDALLDAYDGLNCGVWSFPDDRTELGDIVNGNPVQNLEQGKLHLALDPRRIGDDMLRAMGEVSFFYGQRGPLVLASLFRPQYPFVEVRESRLTNVRHLIPVDNYIEQLEGLAINSGRPSFRHSNKLSFRSVK